MRKMLFIRKFKVNVSLNTINLSCVFMIAFLMCACAGTKKMQTSSAADEAVEAYVKNDIKKNETSEKLELASVTDDSALGEITEDQTIECKRIAPTGSRLKKKVCKTKAQWAREAGVGNKTAGDLQKDTDRNGSLAVPTTDAMGGMSVGVPR